MALLLEDAFLPATLTVPPMTDQEFAAFCAEHPDLFFEMTAVGELIVLQPSFSLTGTQNLKILVQLGVWAERDLTGVVSDSSTGFVLPNGARRSPDASWTPNSEIQKLSPESRNGFWHLCPAFVIELRSKSARILNVREKMREYIANGAKLGWLVDPETRKVESHSESARIFRAARVSKRFSAFFSSLPEGSTPFAFLPIFGRGSVSPRGQTHINDLPTNR